MMINIYNIIIKLHLVYIFIIRRMKFTETKFLNVH